jgi:hypothetical protein
MPARSDLTPRRRLVRSSRGAWLCLPLVRGSGTDPGARRAPIRACFPRFPGLRATGRFCFSRIQACARARQPTAAWIDKPEASGSMRWHVQLPVFAIPFV